MSEKVILVLVDGLRPDAMVDCGHPFVRKLLDDSAYALDAQTVDPSVTLPCHMSLFQGVDPNRHGIMSNQYVPQVRPIMGLVDQLDTFGKQCGMFYNWEQLRDLTRPGHLHTSVYMNLHRSEDTDGRLTDACLEFANKFKPDFTFLYLGETDKSGHDDGWLSENYMKTIYHALSCIQRVYENMPDGYTLIVTADHGGHERTHGTTMPEDMNIPVIFNGPRFAKGKELENVSIKDIASTVAELLEVPAAKEWEGVSRC